MCFCVVFKKYFMQLAYKKCTQAKSVIETKSCNRWGVANSSSIRWETRVPALLKVPKKLFTFQALFSNREMNKRVRKNYPFCDFETTSTWFVS